MFKKIKNKIPYDGHVFCVLVIRKINKQEFQYVMQNDIMFW
jgi:hypothetical protein